MHLFPSTINHTNNICRVVLAWLMRPVPKCSIWSSTGTCLYFKLLRIRASSDPDPTLKKDRICLAPKMNRIRPDRITIPHIFFSRLLPFLNIATHSTHSYLIFTFLLQYRIRKEEFFTNRIRIRNTAPCAAQSF